MNYLFVKNQLSPYAKSKDRASRKTIERKRERTRGFLIPSHEYPKYLQQQRKIYQ